MKEVALRSVWQNPIHFVACGFGSGTLPGAPGTWGTVIAVPFYLCLMQLSFAMYGLFLLVAIVGGIGLCHITAKDFGQSDPPAVVWDEMVGYWLAMWVAPTGWLWVILGFGLFRLLDIVKPWPISYVDRRLKGGVGIMVDDILAAVPVFLLMLVCSWLGF